jgi:hypothetical protein
MLLDAEKPIIPVEKLRDYLLSGSHPIGRYKATFFLNLGYSQEGWTQLELDLRAVLSGVAEPADDSPYGQKFIVRGSLLGPSGRSARVITVWTILTGEAAPRFVTAYPEE